MITLNFDEVLERTYNAKKGVDVRYGLGQGFEYCKQFADEAQGYATNAKASEKKATDAVAGIEQTKTDAVQAVQNAQTTATTAVQQAQTTATDAVAAKQTEAVQAVGTAKNEAVAAVDSERDAALQQVANSTKAAQTAATNAAASEQAASESKTAAATSAEAAASSATAASGSASAAAASETNASQSAENSEASAVRSEAAAKKAEAVVGTDKTLTVSGAPADAAATGEELATKADKDVILDEEGNVLFYSKTAVDELLAKKLDLTGGTMTGPISALNAGDYVFASNNTVAGKDSLISIKNEADGTTIAFGIGNGGKTFGIVEQSKSRWPMAEDLETGNLYFDADKIFFRGHEDPYVVASGSNYVRFGDGTQICWGTAQLPSAVSTRNTASFTFTFPIAFADTNYIKTISQRNDPGGSWNVAIANTGMRTTAFDALVVNGDTSVALNAGAIFEYIAVGRWK